MTFWNSLQLKINLLNDNELTINQRFFWLKKCLVIFVCLTMSPNLIFYDIAYDISLLNEKRFFSFLYESLPEILYSQIQSRPYLVTLTLLFLIPFILRQRTNPLISLSFCLLVNVQLLLTANVNSGATSITANMASYIFVFDMISFINFRLSDYFKLLLANIIRIQLSIVYIVAGVAKIASPLWIGGFATYYIFRNERYFKFPWLLDIFDQFDFLYPITSYLPIIFLLSFPLGIWTKQSKKFIVASFVFHGFIAVFMGLREFMIFPFLNLIFFSKHLKVHESILLTSRLDSEIVGNVSEHEVQQKS